MAAFLSFGPAPLANAPAGRADDFGFLSDLLDPLSSMGGVAAAPDAPPGLDLGLGLGVNEQPRVTPTAVGRPVLRRG